MMTREEKNTRRFQVICEYVLWKMRNNETVDQKYLDILGDDLPRILQKLNK
jgi:hypothetical protein